jgi:hypothetical protein
VRPALQTCACSLSLSGPGQSFASESYALNSDQLRWQFTQCVTRRTLSPHPAPQYTSLCQRYAIGGDYSPPAFGICALRGGHFVRSSVRCVRTRTPRLPKTHPLPAPMPSRVPTPRQHIPCIPRGIGFLGYPAHLWLAAGCLLHFRRAISGLSRSVCPFSVTTGRYSTPGPTFRVNTL